METSRIVGKGVVPLGVNNLEVKSVRNDERKVGLYEL